MLRRYLLGIALPFSLVLTLAAQKPKAKPNVTGEQVYRAQCASCHGAKGQGGAAYPKALVGSQSAGQLAQFIAKSMPPGPKKCTSEDAQKVASYVYDAFYSPVAQERNRPARVLLSRLTVRQYRSVLADLLLSFRPSAPLGEVHGLRAEYFKAKRFQANERVLQRVDPEVRFDFGTEGPVPNQFEPHQFSIRWEGSLLAPDSGEYELVIQSDHAVRIWVNDLQKPLIDAWVKSGKDTEFRAPLTLIGGRAYPLRLEFSKSTQGVDDTAKKQGKPAPPAFVRLAWRRPKLDQEVIPARCLLPATAPETFVPTTPFPPDDRSMGYERGNAISKAWEEATTSGALETAAYITEHRRELAGTTNDPVKLKAFCRKFVERALRQPLSEETAKQYIDRQFAATPDPEMALKRVVLLTLQSPRFLYREPGAVATDAYAVASRLSFALWDSLPDEALLQAAAAGKLTTREQVRQQAERMAADPRTRTKQREFFLQWLRVDHYPDLAKDTKRFPDFTPEVATDLRTSLELSLEKTLASEKADLRELLQGNTLFLNGHLAKLYGAELPADAPFQEVVLDPKERAGVLTHPYILASFAYLGATSPIHRGVLVARSMMGRTLAPPPVAVAPLAADLHPGLTTRQRVILQTKPAACQSCHNMINPLGFTLERFDAIGRLRTSENSKPIDCSGSYQTRTGKTVTFGGAQDLARFLATSEEAQSAFVEKFFQFNIKQPLRAYGPQTLPLLQKSFVGNAYSIRQLQIEIATTAALHKEP